MARDLDRLATLWGTDKGPGRHCYTQYYAAHLRRRRGAVEAVLEIGVGGNMDPHHGGHSLFMWRNYFPRATVYGLDLFEKRLDAGARIVTLQADQADPDALARALSGCPAFDLIVDDGDHVGEHIIVSFENLFGRLRPGGLYAIEDLATAYWEGWGGGPPGTPDTAVALLKDLVDELNLGTGRPLASIHAYPGLVLIEKDRVSAIA